MDPIESLKADHKRVRQLFEEYEGAGEQAHKTRRRTAEKAIEEIETHARLEEELFYPAVREKGGEEAKDMVMEAIEEHHVAKMLMRELKKLKPESERFDPKFKVLMESVKHHLQEEEQEMFPQAESLLAGDRQALGAKMEARRKELERERRK